MNTKALAVEYGFDYEQQRQRRIPMPKLFENAFTHAAIGMALVAPDGRWLRVNRSLCDLVGYAEEELLALTFQDITHPADLETDLAYAGQLLRGEIEHYQMEKRYRRKDGRLVWVLLSVSLVRHENGEPQFFIAQVQDVTARKEAEQDLEHFFDQPMLFRAIVGSDARFRRVSPQWTKALGYSQEELLAMQPLDLVHPDDLHRTIAAWRGLFEDRPLEFFEHRIRRKNGGYVWLMSCAVGLAERQIAFMVATDITPQKEAEMRALLDAAEKRRLYEELRQATEDIRALQEELVTICAWTKQVRCGESWEPVEEFLTRRLRLKLSHGMSDEVAGKMLQEIRKSMGE